MGTAYRGAQDADEYNVADAGSAARVDELNSRFYGEFPFPEPEDRFVRYEDPGFWQLMVNQELGYFGNGPLRSGMKIWVAGCGTNQGIQVALRFPDCQVYATDISPTSLRIAEQAARSLGIANIHFERRSINDGVADRFGYIICIGVIHHNADPRATLSCLVAGLEDDGVLELMVYNRFQRVEAVAMQKALRLLAADHADRDDTLQLSLAKRLIDGLDGESDALDVLRKLRFNQAEFVNTFIQPVEWSYTVHSLAALARSAGAVLWLPTQTVGDSSTRRHWALSFSDAYLRERYRSLPDIDRWQLVNLLMAERSPALWFYLRPARIPRPPFLSDEVAARFLDTRFGHASTMATGFVRDAFGACAPYGRPRHHPPGLPAARVRRLFDAADGTATMRDLLSAAGQEELRDDLWGTRLSLAVPLAPFLMAAP